MGRFPNKSYAGGTKEEGKYKNNILVTSQRKKHLLFVRSSKLRERIDDAVANANRAATIALQKADIAVSRTATAKDRAEQADYASLQAGEDSDVARLHAKQFDPNFHQPGTEVLKKQRLEQGNHVAYVTPPSITRAQPLEHQPNPHTRSAPFFQQPKNNHILEGGYTESRSAETELTPPMMTPPSEPQQRDHPQLSSSYAEETLTFLWQMSVFE